MPLESAPALHRLATRLRPMAAPGPAGAIALFAIAFSVFGPAAGHSFTSWDDDLYLLRNPLVEDLSPAGVARIFTSFSLCNYHPLTILSFAVERAVVGTSPWLYFLDNAILHAASSALAFLLCRRWLRHDGAAFLAAALFSIHPLRVESVSWAAERKDVLCAFFYLAALLAWPDPTTARGGRRRAASLALFVLSLLSKAMAVTLPAVLVLRLLGEGRASRRELLRTVPFFALAAAFSGLGFAAQAADGAVHGLHGGSLLNHVLTVPRALAFYLGKLALPVGLSPRYMLPPASGPLDPMALAGIGLAAAGVAAAIADRRPGRPVMLGLGFFALAWAPVCGIVPLSTIVADRYMYLPALGLFLALAAVASAPRPPGMPVRSRILPDACLAAGLALVAASMALTPARVRVWRDGETLWSDALRQDPRNPVAHNQLTLSFLARGRYREAAGAAMEAARSGARDPAILVNLCVAYRQIGDRERELETARGILAAFPDFPPAWSVVLRSLREEGRFDECRRQLDDLLSRHPGAPPLLASLGGLEEAAGDLPAALAAYLRAIERGSEDAEVFLATARVLAGLGDSERAAALAERTARSPTYLALRTTRSLLGEVADTIAEGGDLPRAARVRALLE